MGMALVLEGLVNMLRPLDITGVPFASSYEFCITTVDREPGLTLVLFDSQKRPIAHLPTGLKGWSGLVEDLTAKMSKLVMDGDQVIRADWNARPN